jgi:hypothetical protein
MVRPEISNLLNQFNSLENKYIATEKISETYNEIEQITNLEKEE